MDSKASASDRARAWFDVYTRDFSREDFQRLFTQDTADAYDFFSRGLAEDNLKALPWWKQVALRFRQVFVAFTLRLPPVDVGRSRFVGHRRSRVAGDGRRLRRVVGRTDRAGGRRHGETQHACHS